MEEYNLGLPSISEEKPSSFHTKVDDNRESISKRVTIVAASEDEGKGIDENKENETTTQSVRTTIVRFRPGSTASCPPLSESVRKMPLRASEVQYNTGPSKYVQPMSVKASKHSTVLTTSDGKVLQPVEKDKLRTSTRIDRVSKMSIVQPVTVDEEHGIISPAQGPVIYGVPRLSLTKKPERTSQRISVADPAINKEGFISPSHQALVPTIPRMSVGKRPSLRQSFQQKTEPDTVASQHNTGLGKYVQPMSIKASKHNTGLTTNDGKVLQPVEKDKFRTSTRMDRISKMSVVQPVTVDKENTSVFPAQGPVVYAVPRLSLTKKPERTSQRISVTDTTINKEGFISPSHQALVSTIPRMSVGNKPSLHQSVQQKTERESVAKIPSLRNSMQHKPESDFVARRPSLRQSIQLKAEPDPVIRRPSLHQPIQQKSELNSEARRPSLLQSAQRKLEPDPVARRQSGQSIQQKTTSVVRRPSLLQPVKAETVEKKSSVVRRESIGQKREPFTIHQDQSQPMGYAVPVMPARHRTSSVSRQSTIQPVRSKTSITSQQSDVKSQSSKTRAARVSFQYAAHVPVITFPEPDLEIISEQEGKEKNSPLITCERSSEKVQQIAGGNFCGLHSQTYLNPPSQTMCTDLKNNV